MLERLHRSAGKSDQGPLGDGMPDRSIAMGARTDAPDEGDLHLFARHWAIIAVRSHLAPGRMRTLPHTRSV